MFADDDAITSVIDIDLSTVPSTVAAPHLPENTKPVTEFADVKIDQAVIAVHERPHRRYAQAAAKILAAKSPTACAPS